MSGVIFRGVAGSPGSSVTTTSVFTTPAGVVAGDTLLVLMAQSVTGINWNTSIPAGWTAQTAIVATASMQLFSIKLTSAPAATYTFTASVAHVAGGIMIGYGNVANFDPALSTSGVITASNTNMGTNTIVTTSVTDTLVLLGFVNSAAGNFVPQTIPAAAGPFNIRGSQVNTTTSTNANVGLTAQDFPFTAANGGPGSVSTAVTLTTARINGAVLLSLKPNPPQTASVTAPGMEDSLEPGITAVGQAMATTNLW